MKLKSEEKWEDAFENFQDALASLTEEAPIAREGQETEPLDSDYF